MAGNKSCTITNPISECFIKPKYEVEASKQPYYLSAADLIFLDAPYMKRGFLFTKPTSSFNIHAFTRKLQRALSHALVHFYPLAGRFVTETYEDERACWIYLDCNKGSGARFIHAACDTVTIADVVSPDPNLIPDIRVFFDLGERDIVNHDGHTRALASIQVTELIDGIFIGISMSHSLGDGSSFWHFINTLSEIFEQMDNNNEESVMISRVPIFNPIFPEGYGPIIKLPYPNMFMTRTTPANEESTDMRTFHFSPTSVMRLKALANNDKNIITCNWISSFQSIAALLWRSINRARALDSEVESIMNLLADGRPRFNPPLSADHFGNVILRIQGKSKVGELLSNGLSWAAMVINQAIAAKNGQLTRDKDKFVVDLLLKGQRFPSGSQDTSEVTIGGSTRFNIYGSEFALGKAVAVRTEYSGKTDGTVIANPGRDDGGSVDLEVSLLPGTMSALERDEEFMSYVS